MCMDIKAGLRTLSHLIISRGRDYKYGMLNLFVDAKNKTNKCTAYGWKTLHYYKYEFESLPLLYYKWKYVGIIMAWYSR